MHLASRQQTGIPIHDHFTGNASAEIQRILGVLPGENLEVTVSIGVADASPAMSGFEAMLKRADEALYEAKRMGRDRVVRAPKPTLENFSVAAE